MIILPGAGVVFFVTTTVGRVCAESDSADTSKQQISGINMRRFLS
jgi:hypothetical protein